MYAASLGGDSCCDRTRFPSGQSFASFYVSQADATRSVCKSERSPSVYLRIRQS